MPNCNCPPASFHPLSSGGCGSCNQFSDRRPYFEDVEELRSYIVERESKRKLEDLINVEDGIGNYAEGQILAFDPVTQVWSIVQGFEPIIW